MLCILSFNRPGFTRINLPYFLGDEEMSFILKAVALVSDYGWKLLPQVTDLVAAHSTERTVYTDIYYISIILVFNCNSQHFGQEFYFLHKKQKHDFVLLIQKIIRCL